jgi:hypothetical protein
VVPIRHRPLQLLACGKVADVGFGAPQMDVKKENRRSTPPPFPLSGGAERKHSILCATDWASIELISANQRYISG